MQYLIDRLFLKIQRYILNNGGSSEDAKDIFNTAIYEVLNKGYTLNSEIEPLLIVIAKRRWLNHLNSVKKEHSCSFFDENICHEQSIEPHICDIQSKQAILNIISRLDSTCSTIIKYKHFEGYDLEQIRRVLDFKSKDAVKTKHYKCKSKLKHYLRQIGNNVTLLKDK
jgi:RNA polymerase sigma factor (sigma-70 family)